MPYIVYMHHTVYIYALYMPIYQEVISKLKKWGRYHKSMYFGHCAMNNDAISNIKKQIERYG
jgi:hypothetical protein